MRFIQLYHRGWDQHNDLPRDLALQCRGTDQPTAALVTDLKQRGLLDETLVVWGGEFGRTVFSQGKLTDANYGRDHHPRNFCMWVAGGGMKRGSVLGETDDFSYNVVSDPCLGLRPAGDDPARAGHRPQAADLPVPGTRFPADRRPRRGGDEDTRLGRTEDGRATERDAIGGPPRSGGKPEGRRAKRVKRVGWGPRALKNADSAYESAR